MFHRLYPKSIPPHHHIHKLFSTTTKKNYVRPILITTTISTIFIYQIIKPDWNKINNNWTQFAPSALITHSQYMNAIESNPHIIQKIPPNLITNEMYVLAIKNGYPLHRIPDSHRTKAVIISGIESGTIKHPYNIPKECLTQDVCELFIKYGIADGLAYFPNEYKTYELCQVAVRKNGHMITYVPEEHKTEEMWKDAIKTNPYCVYSIKDRDSFNQEFWSYAITHKVQLWYVPQQYITQEICDRAVKNDSYNFRSVPNKFKTKEMCEMLIKDPRYVSVQPGALEHIPEQFITQELCDRFIILGRDFYSFEYIPTKYINKEIREAIVMRYHEIARAEQLTLTPILKNMSEDIMTQQMCEEAVKEQIDNLLYVPDKYLSHKMRKIVVKKYGLIIDRLILNEPKFDFY